MVAESSWPSCQAWSEEPAGDSLSQAMESLSGRGPRFDVAETSLQAVPCLNSWFEPTDSMSIIRYSYVLGGAIGSGLLAAIEK